MVGLKSDRATEISAKVRIDIIQYEFVSAYTEHIIKEASQYCGYICHHINQLGLWYIYFSL